MTGERNIFLATQHDATVDEPNTEQIYTVGTLGRILQAQRQENGQIKVVVEGRERGQSIRVEQDEDGMFFAHVRKISQLRNPATDGRTVAEIHTWSNNFCAFPRRLHRRAARQPARNFRRADCRRDEFSFAHRVDEKQELLEIFSVQERLQKLCDSRSRNRKTTARPMVHRARKNRWTNISANIT